MTLSWNQALAWRMRQQFLDPVGSESAEGVVRRLGAIPARSEPTSELMVRLRREHSQRGEVAAALADGRLIKTYAFRGATHLMTPEEGASYLAIRAASRMWELPSWQEYYRLAPSDWPVLRQVVRDVLAAGPLTREELADAVARVPRFAHLAAAIAGGSDTLLKPLAWHGDLCFGPTRDGRSTFQSLEDNPRWVGLPDLGRAGVLAIRAYLRAYGPSTPAHLQYWLGEGLGAPRRLVRSWLATLGEEVTVVEVDGDSALCLQEDFPALEATPATDAVRLLPGHDQWVLGVGTADAHVVPPARRAAVTRGSNLVLKSGVVSGTWKLTASELAVAWFADAGPPPETTLALETAHLAEILGRPLAMTVAQDGWSAPPGSSLRPP